jgi:hypothetical protein
VSWGDNWGGGPCNNARTLAKAFYEGRERTFGQSFVSFEQTILMDAPLAVVYHYKHSAIARFTPECLAPGLVAHRLETGRSFTRRPLQFCIRYPSKGLARHLMALGVEAEWQYGGRPFLVFGAEVPGYGDWWTIEELKALPKWVEPPPTPKQQRRDRFVNLTLPLFP